MPALYPTINLGASLYAKGAKATIPPRKNATLWEEGYPRNEAVTALKAGALAQWKQATGYHQRLKAETAMYRVKQLIGAKLSLRNYNTQVGEALAWVKAINRMTGLGMPVRQQVNLEKLALGESPHAWLQNCATRSIGRVEWKQLVGSNLIPGGQLYQFVRVAAPTSLGQDVDLFLDLTFELKGRFGMQIIVDRLQSRTQLQIAKRPPYYGLLGDFISRARQLEVGEKSTELEGMA